MVPAEGGDSAERRVLLCADKSGLGELARAWAGQCARELDVALVRLPASVATPDPKIKPGTGELNHRLGLGGCGAGDGGVVIRRWVRG